MTEKPPGSPFYIHRNGQWAKKIKGKTKFFGSVREVAHDAAVESYYRYRDELESGERQTVPRPNDYVTVGMTAEAWLVYQRGRCDSGAIKPVTLHAYQNSAEHVTKALGYDTNVATLRPADFAKMVSKLSERFGVHQVAKTVVYTKSLFRWAYEVEELIDQPVRFGPAFTKPPQREVRRAKRELGPQGFTKEEVNRMLTLANPRLRAMILLGLNAGFGQTDCSELPIDAIDLDCEIPIIDWYRPKTENIRRAPLWPITIEAVRAVFADPRPAVDDAHHDRLFLTRNGTPYVRVTRRVDGVKHKISKVDIIGYQFKSLMTRAEIKKPRHGFYTLRRMFRTHAAACDNADAGELVPAIDLIMGHVTEGVGPGYVQRISDERLKAITDFVMNAVL